MQAIKKILWKNLPFERRQRMDIHLDNMVAEIKYLTEKRSPTLFRAFELGWTAEILRIVCVLSVFNHYIVGPLFTSGKKFSSSKYGDISSISHGSFLLDENSSKKILEACENFHSIVTSLAISLNVIHSITVNDMVYYIVRENQNENR